MGCPDWPRCFDQYIPPTSADQLPVDYKEKYRHHRAEKVVKFSKFLTAIGFQSTAQKLQSDPSLWVEQDFNALKTWVEYINRLIGFVAGNLVLIVFVWTFFRYRNKRTLTLLTGLNVVLIGIEAWFGSIVVATNLVPWTITVHLVIALLIVGIQIKVIRIIRQKTYPAVPKPWFKYLFYTALIITFLQMIIGTQVRQGIDEMVKDMVDRASWIARMKGDFYFHRSFSWVLLAINSLLLYVNHRRHYAIFTLKLIVGLILVEFITGVLFAYANMPAFTQPIHLLTASILLGVQWFSLEFFNHGKDEGKDGAHIP